MFWPRVCVFGAMIFDAFVTKLRQTSASSSYEATCICLENAFFPTLRKKLELISNYDGDSES